MFQVQIQTPSEWRTVSFFEDLHDAFDKADELQRLSPMRRDYARVQGPKGSTYYISEFSKEEVVLHGIRIFAVNRHDPVVS